MRPLPSLAALLLLAAVPAAAEDAPPSPRDLAARLWAAKPGERAAVVDAIVAAKPDPEAMAKALEAGPVYAADVPRGWLEITVPAPDGKSRPCLLHVPEKYDPAKPHRVVIDMHGGVSRPKPLAHEELLEMKYFWGADAEEAGWILAIPAGDADATWWNATGAGMVLGLLRETKRTYHVDDDAVFATGFSDGGSGAFHLAAAHPTPFAGFLPLNGHPSVAGMGGVPVFARNLLRTPIYAVNTDGDSLYPSASLRPIFEALKGLGAPLVWREIEGFAHDPSYLPAERPAIRKWMDATRRDPFPKVLHWEGIAGAPGRVHWLRVTEVTGGSGKEPFPDVNPLLRETRARLGVMLDEAFPGPGARIVRVVDGSVAKGMDLREGDVLLSLDGAAVEDAPALRRLLSRKAFGQEVKVSARRGKETLALSGRFPDAKSEPAFARDVPWGSLRAEAKGNRIEVACLGIGAFEVLLSPRLVDLAKPVEVVVNGTVAFSGPAAPDLRFLLGQAADDGDRSLVYRARLAVAVPKGE